MDVAYNLLRPGKFQFGRPLKSRMAGKYVLRIQSTAVGNARTTRCAYAIGRLSLSACLREARARGDELFRSRETRTSARLGAAGFARAIVPWFADRRDAIDELGHFADWGRRDCF
jgi:hypothetical protein